MMKDLTQRRKGAKRQRAFENKSMEAKREVFPHGYLKTASWYMLKQAKTAHEGNFYTILSSMLFSAFCMEAYLNYLGSQIIDSWQYLERKLGPNEKLSLICEFLSFDLNRGEKPFQTFGDMFEFRNWMVHAKPEYIVNKPDEIIEWDDGWLPDDVLPSKWKNRCTIENAQQFYDDARKMMKQLHELSGLPVSYLVIPERFSYLSTSHDSLDELDEEE